MDSNGTCTAVDQLDFQKQFERDRKSYTKKSSSESKISIANANSKKRKNKTLAKPTVEVTVIPKVPLKQESSGFGKKKCNEIFKKRVFNHDTFPEYHKLKIFLGQSREIHEKRVYELKNSKSDILHYKYKTKYDVYMPPHLKRIDMDRSKRKEIKTTRIKKINKNCDCEMKDGYYSKLDDEQKSRVKIIGQLGLTQDEQYVLHCAATVDNKPIATNFMLPHDSFVRLNSKQNIPYNTATHATQADLNLAQEKKNISYKNQTVQCDCNREVDATISKTIFKECKSPLVIISVYQRPGEMAVADSCPVKIIQHSNLDSNFIQSRNNPGTAKSQKKQKSVRSLTERIRRSPSPVNKSKNTYIIEEKGITATTSKTRQKKLENRGNRNEKLTRVTSNPNNLNKDVTPDILDLSRQQYVSKDKSKTLKKNAEQVKKALVSDFLKNIDKIDRSKPKTKMNPKDNASKITINIDGSCEDYDVMFERNAFDTGVTVRKKAKGNGMRKNNEKADVDSMRNVFNLSDDITKAGYSRQQNYMCKTKSTKGSELNVRDSLEINHRREREHSNVKTGNVPKKFDIKKNKVHLKHFRGDDCSITDPNERDKEIRELLGIISDTKKSNINADEQDKSCNCVKKCSKSLITENRISYHFLEPPTTATNENIKSVKLLAKDENYKTSLNCSAWLKKSSLCAYGTNSLLLPQNLVLNRNFQVFIQLKQLPETRRIILTRKQYEKIKRNVRCVPSRKLSADKKYRNVSIGTIKIRPKVQQPSQCDRGVQAEWTEPYKMLGNKKRHRANAKRTNAIQPKLGSTKSVFFQDFEYIKEKYSRCNSFRNAVSSIEIRFTDVEQVKDGQNCIQQNNSVKTIFKGHRKCVTPNLGTSGISLSSDRSISNISIKPTCTGDYKIKKPFLRRLISCLGMRSPPVFKAEMSEQNHTYLNNSVDSYYISSSLGAIEMSSSLYDTSASFFSNHTVLQLNRPKRGFFTSVREFLTRRRI